MFKNLFLIATLAVAGFAASSAMIVPAAHAMRCVFCYRPPTTRLDQGPPIRGGPFHVHWRGPCRRPMVWPTLLATTDT
jgi:hypothetical protein